MAEPERATTSSQSVVIPITGDSLSCHREWTILELNGELIIPTELPTAANQQTVILGPDQVELGALRFEDDKTPVIILGSHELQGTVQNLKQPFCVFEKLRGESAGATPVENEPDLRYKVAGLITKKLLFNNYPKTIMK